MKIYGDHLTRMQTVTDITDIVASCVKTKHPVSFSIEGEWGRGKTWIIDRVSYLLQGVDLSQEHSQKDKRKNNGDYLVFLYNAWEKDYYDEPLLAILITLVNHLNEELYYENFLNSEIKVLYEETKEILETALRTISKRVIGVDVVDVGKRGVKIFKKIKDGAKIELNADYAENIEKDIKTVVQVLNTLSEKIPIVFIVDELDRCIPSHAIRTLERLHHVFGKVESSVTIISINEKQLKNTVEQMFGKDISFEAYLRKFIDFRISLDSGCADNMQLRAELNSFFELFELDGNVELQDEILTNICTYMTAREYEKVCKNAMLCHSLVKKECERLSKDCAVAEIFLFACKVALEKEDLKADILPTCGNRPDTQLGRYIKNFLMKMRRNTDLNMEKSLDLILYICADVLRITNEMNVGYSALSESYVGIVEFYKEYARYYKLIK